MSVRLLVAQPRRQIGMHPEAQRLLAGWPATHDPRVMEHAGRLVRLVDGKVENAERRDA